MEHYSSTPFVELPFPLEWLPQDTCLVGGTVRDALLNRNRAEFDIDLVLTDKAAELAGKVARRCQAGFVVLDEQRDIARVVFKEGTVDFAKIEGNSLEQDLQRRDFTINAIAYHLHEQQFIDPLGGQQDLEAGIVRMISATNLKDDPLRLLRAYRQGAQLEFTIDEETRQTIRDIAPALKKVAAERIQTELSYLFASWAGSAYLQQAWQDGVLSSWFPTLTKQQVQQVPKIDEAQEALAQQWPHLVPEWNQNVGGESDSMQALAKLACLVPLSDQQAETKLTELRYSRAEIRTVTKTVSVIPQLLEKDVEVMSLRNQYFFFQEVVDIFPCVLLTAIAKGLEIAAMNPLIERYLNPQDPVAYPQPIVTGKDLLRSLPLSPSPLIGEFLTELQIAYIEGRVHSREQALELAKTWIE